MTADKPHLIEPQMDYDIVEDIKKIKANVSLFEMCKVPQQKERLLKALEADKIPEFTITSQDPRQKDTLAKPNEEKVTADKPHLIEPQMDYDIVEDIKKKKANISLFEMCKVPQQKEILLKSLEASDEGLPTDNQPQEEEEIGETGVGGKSKSKHPPFLLMFEIFNHNVHNCLVDS